MKRRRFLKNFAKAVAVAAVVPAVVIPKDPEIRHVTLHARSEGEKMVIEFQGRKFWFYKEDYDRTVHYSAARERYVLQNYSYGA